jgi:glutaredoxin
MKLVFFVKDECEACKNAKEKVAFFLDKWGAADTVATEAISLDSEDGLVEAAMQGVADVPTIILERDGSEVARWGRKAPPSEELRAKLGL